MIGQVISHYHILEKLGEGGMGVVYKAQDTRLDRPVALKFLPPYLHASESDKARFLQEAKAAAALNHPNICSVIDVQEAEGGSGREKQIFIVMEYIDGQTLKERLQGTGVRVQEAINIGMQIAEGLAAAHEKGIVHRDIKPENIMVRKDGIVQIMDFGLAKLRATRVTRLTREGSTVGTAGFMSPEQVQGQEVDHRSDIFSLGVLLYEMITGQLPFKGVHETALLYEIVNVDAPSIRTVKPDIDPELDRIVMECLEKEPSERYQSAAEVAKDLRRLRRASTRHGVSTVSGGRMSHGDAQSMSPEGLARIGYNRRRQLGVIVALASLIGMLTFGILYVTRPQSELRLLRFPILPPEKGDFYFLGAGAGAAGAGPMALSSDGQRLTYVATTPEGKRVLWVRSLDQLSSVPLAGTEGASYPFWSADDRFIGYFADGKLKRIEASGGPPFTICDAPDGRGAAWGADGVIVFAPGTSHPLFAVSAAGGAPTVVTRLDTARNVISHRWPAFLPDGRTFLYFARVGSAGSQSEGDAVYASSIDGKVNARLLSTHCNAVYANGHLLFLRGATLMAQSFNPQALRLRDDPVPLVDQVQYDLIYSKAIFSVSATGILAYQSGSGESGSRLSLLDEKGSQRGFIGELALYYDYRFSPDGRKVAIAMFDQQARNFDIWLYEFARKVRTRFTFDPAIDRSPVWSPNGSRIVFRSNRNGHYDLYEKASSGEGIEELLFESPEDKVPTDWSPDGKFIAYYTVNDPKTREDLWVLPTFGDKKPLRFLQTEFSEAFPRFSPDGRWLTYHSDETGTSQIYVRPFLGRDGQPATGNASSKWQISTAGGTRPIWSHDGRKIFYLGPTNTLMMVGIHANGPTIEVGDVKTLFEARTLPGGNGYDVSSDSRSFLVGSIVEHQTSSPIIVVVNWPEELPKR